MVRSVRIDTGVATSGALYALSLNDPSIRLIIFEIQKATIIIHPTPRNSISQLSLPDLEVMRHLKLFTRRLNPSSITQHFANFTSGEVYTLDITQHPSFIIIQDPKDNEFT